MIRTRHQIIVAKTMQQGVHAVERIDLAETVLDLFPQNRAVVCRQAFIGIGSLVEHRAEFLLLLTRELGRGAGLTLGNQRVDAAPAITADPLIHKLTRSTDDGGYLLALQFCFSSQSVPRDQRHAIAITLLGIGCGGD
jgi:hypothetical protein